MFLLVAALLSCCAVAGGASDESEPMKILASAGGTVILPCHINVSGDVPEVEWSKEGQHPEIAFLYRHGCETYEMKDLVFQYRTNLFMNELKNGNVSLRISNVRLSDAGKYICKTLQKPPQEVVTWELVVGEVSEPVLSIVEFADAGVTLQCEAKCWFPEPEITFLSEQGNISAENPRSDPDSRGCFNVKRRVTVQTAAARFRVTCRVHQPEMNQTRVTVIYIPAGSTRSCTVATCICVTLCVILFVLIVVFWWKKGCNTVRDCSCWGGQPTKVHLVDDNRTDTTEHLRAIDELTKTVHDKEEIIRQQTEELKDLRSKQSPVVCQPTFDNSPAKSSPDVSKPMNLPQHLSPYDNNPKPAASTNSDRPKPNLSRNKYPKPKPAISIQVPAPGPLIPCAVSPGLTPEDSRVRSMSLSGHRQNSASPKRRYTLDPSNPFSVLADLPEDSETLLS